jgi:hypothetical protein
MTAPANDRPALPPLWQAVVDERTLDQLFTDLNAAAEIHAIQAKTDSRTLAKNEPLSLDSAKTQLKTGDVCGIQIHYRYDGQEWRDTIMRMQKGSYRLVRMQAVSG